MEQDLLDINLEVSRKVTAILDLDQLLQETGLILQNLLRRYMAAIFLLDADRQELTLATFAGPGITGKPHTYSQSTSVGLLGRCVTSGQPVLVNDVREDADYVTAALPEICAELDVPIRLDGRILGVLTLMDTRVNAFTGDDVCIAQAVADQIAVALHNAQLHSALQQQVRQLSAIYDTSLDIVARLDMDDLLREIVERAIPLLHADAGGVYLHDPASDTLQLAVGGRYMAPYQGLRLPMGAGLVGHVFRGQTPFIIDNYKTWAGRSVTDAPGEPAFTALAVPLTYADQRLGVLTVTSCNLEVPFRPADLRLATLFANQATVAIVNARLHAELREQATRDSLTGLHNRRYFVDKLRQWSAGPNPAVVVMMDVDGLKGINDTGGHATGDALLCAMAELLRAHVVPDAVLARLSGDEFATLSASLGAGSAAAWLRDLSARVRAFNAGTRPFQLNFSVGIAARRPYEHLEATLRRADERLYWMKHVQRAPRRAGA